METLAVRNVETVEEVIAFLTKYVAEDPDAVYIGVGEPDEILNPVEMVLVEHTLSDGSKVRDVLFRVTARMS